MMKFVSMGDMAQTMALRRQNLHLNAELLKLSKELSTGETTDPARHLGGDFRYLSDVEYRSKVMTAYELAAAEAEGLTSAMSLALEQIQTGSEDLAANLLTASEGTQETWIVLSTQASEQLQVVVSALNTSYAGRSLFAGDATDRPAIAMADTILTSVRENLVGLQTAEDIQQAVSDWFAVGGGFDDIAYLGSDQASAPIRVGERDMIQLDLRADASELRDVMSKMTLAAISQDIAQPDLQKSLLETAGLELLEQQDNLTALRADLGFAQGRIEEIGVRLAAEKVALSFARETLLGVDEFETASKLESAQFHLEALYTVTARLSGLSLVNYL